MGKSKVETNVSGADGALDAAAGRDDGAEGVAVLGAALPPIAGGCQFSAGGLQVEGAAGVVVVGVARPAAFRDGHGCEQARGIHGEAGTDEDAGAAEICSWWR